MLRNEEPLTFKEIAEQVTNCALSCCIRPPVLHNVAKAVNDNRKKFQPQEPTDLYFQIDEAETSEFLQADVRHRGQRHIIFATSQQLQFLTDAHRLYFDGTFKVIREPFKQLYSVHAYIESGDAIKQVPLMYIFMSGRKESDYIEVLKAMQRLVPSG